MNNNSSSIMNTSYQLKSDPSSGSIQAKNSSMPNMDRQNYAANSLMLQRPSNKQNNNNSDSDSYITLDKAQHLNAQNLQQLNHIEEQVDEGDEMGKTTHANKFAQNYDIDDQKDEEEEEVDEYIDQAEFELIQAVENLQQSVKNQQAA